MYLCVMCICVWTMSCTIDGNYDDSRKIFTLCSKFTLSHSCCVRTPLALLAPYLCLPVCTTPHLLLDLVKHMVPCLKKPLTHHKKSTCCMNGILKKERTVSPWHWPTKKDCTSTYIERSSICPLQWTRSCLAHSLKKEKKVSYRCHTPSPPLRHTFQSSCCYFLR